MSEENNTDKPGFFKRVVGGVGKVVDWVNPLDNLADKIKKSGDKSLEEGHKVSGTTKKIVGGILNVASDTVEAIPGGPQTMISSGGGKAVGEIMDATRGTENGKIEDLVKAGYGTKDQLKKELQEYKQESASTLRGEGTAKALGKMVVGTVTGADLSRNEARHFSEMKKNGGSMKEFDSLQDIAKKAKDGKENYMLNIDIDDYGKFVEDRTKFSKEGGDPKKFTEAAKKELKEGDSLHSFNQSTDDKKERKQIIEQQQQSKSGKKTASNDIPQEIADKLKSGQLASAEHSHSDGQTVSPPSTGSPAQQKERGVVA